MGKLLASTTSGISLLEEGTYNARIFIVADLGVSENEFEDTKTKKTIIKKQRKVAIGFELPDELITIDVDGEDKEIPRTLTKQFTNSLHDNSNLYKFIKPLVGNLTQKERKEFDLFDLNGRECQVAVNHVETNKGNMWVNIESMMKVPKNTSVSELTNDMINFVLDPDDLENECAKIVNLPKWVRKSIRSSITYDELNCIQYDPDHSADEDEDEEGAPDETETKKSSVPTEDDEIDKENDQILEILGKLDAYSELMPLCEKKYGKTYTELNLSERKDLRRNLQVRLATEGPAKK